MSSFSITGNLVDVFQKKIYPAEVQVENAKIISINILPASPLSDAHFILPGFTDAHVHIESSMLIPSEFARLAVVHGTVATVSDPHEIANVCGIKGVEFMIDNGKSAPFKFYFGAPSCVPATVFETAGGVIDIDDIKNLLQQDEIKYLSEMMNFPGVLNSDADVMEKISIARKLNKPVDGHAPGLRGEEAKRYIRASLNPSERGNSQLHESSEFFRMTSEAESSLISPSGGGGAISTDHECFTAEEALDKLKYGMKIIIREGSAAKNFDALIDLLNDYPDMIMFCSDDKHPDSLVESHINKLCARAVAKGIDVFKVLQAACINPVLHYKLNVGLLREGDAADFILVNNLEDFEVTHTYINGELVAKNGESLISSQPSEIINHFNCEKKIAEDFEFHLAFNNNNAPLTIPVIEALDGQLITNNLLLPLTPVNNQLASDVQNDILKIVVVNRYANAPIAKAFIKNFGLKEGALASSVAHDSHNIVAVGVDDESLCKAVNMIIEHKGGVSCVKNNFEMIVPLPVAGLMSNHDGYKVAEQYSLIDKAAKEAGCTLSSPFMTLSFMALLVIPHLKLSDKGLFNGDTFTFVNDMPFT